MSSRRSSSSISISISSISSTGSSIRRRSTWRQTILANRGISHQQSGQHQLRVAGQVQVQQQQPPLRMVVVAWLRNTPATVALLLAMQQVAVSVVMLLASSSQGQMPTTWLAAEGIANRG